MTSEEEKQIRDWNSEQTHDIQIRLLVTEDQRSNELRGFCEDFARLAPRIRVARDEGESNGSPAIHVGDALRYHAVPLGRELGPFLEALSPSGNKASSISMSVRDHLQRIDLPTVLSLFVAQQCPYCPMTVRQVTPLIHLNKRIRLTIIDSMLFPEMARSNRVQSVPTLILDGEFRWTGSFGLEEVVEVITNRDPSKLGALSLERMLKEGNAVRLAEMMVEKEGIFPAFLDVLTHKEWPVRLGAMVAMEVITERNPSLAAQVIDPLWERLLYVEDPVKGDIIYVLGESGDDGVVSRIETILVGEYHDEVKEAAKEALEKIRAKKR